MAQQTKTEKKGFTQPEKWVIWAVFCLLIGLSVEPFGGRPLSVFAGLLSISFGISLLARKNNIVLAVVLCMFGLLSIVFSRHLI